MKKALILLIVVSLFSFLYAEKKLECHFGFFIICPKRNINTCYCSPSIRSGSFYSIRMCSSRVAFCSGDESNISCGCK